MASAASGPTPARRDSAGIGLDLVDLRRHFGPVQALAGLSLRLAPGELVVLLGPSGCGKTTALRAVAGLERLDGGHILVDGRDVTLLAANRREMGMVFQAYSLFPHLTASENVAFGLRLRKVGPVERRRRAQRLLELVGLATRGEHYPHQLSGGQQQRVALARALAIEPQILLLDEPLSALDAKVRAQLRDEIRRIQLEVGITTLFVTHDQEEALAIADRVAVLHAGGLEQIATPAELYERPRTARVAEFVGLTNRIEGEADGAEARVLGVAIPLLEGSVRQGPITLLVRPETVRVTPAATGNARLVAASFLGAIARLQLRLDDGKVIVAQLPAADIVPFQPGDSLRVSLHPTPALAVER